MFLSNACEICIDPKDNGGYVDKIFCLQKEKVNSYPQAFIYMVEGSAGNLLVGSPFTTLTNAIL